MKLSAVSLDPEGVGAERGKGYLWFLAACSLHPASTLAPSLSKGNGIIIFEVSILTCGGKGFNMVENIKMVAP